MNTRRWVTERIGAPTFEELARGLPSSELWSLLLEVARQRASARAPKDVLAQYLRDGFCAPASVDLRTATALDGHLLEAAAAFEAIELSPVTPLATCASVALTDQNRVLSAFRGNEVVSDPTNVLALECARRLRETPQEAIHLATSQRVVRAQPVPKLPGYSQHFRIFVLASGGAETRDHAFTAETLELHIRTMLAALDRLELNGYAFGARRVEVLATPARAAVADRVAAAFGALAARRALEHPYYSGGIRFQIWVTAPDGAELPLIDGGSFDWLQKLTANRRAVYVATGMGSQLIALRFGRHGTASSA